MPEPAPAGLRRGQRRLFVTFTKIETPDGCMVRIRAPGADALGQAGLDGEIDNHFFQRFGAYIGMAFVDAAMQLTNQQMLPVNQLQAWEALNGDLPGLGLLNVTSPDLLHRGWSAAQAARWPQP